MNIRLTNKEWRQVVRAMNFLAHDLEGGGGDPEGADEIRDICQKIVDQVSVAEKERKNES